MSTPAQQTAPGISISGVFFALASLLCWTVTPLFVFYFTNSFDLWTSNGWRYGMAAMVWLPLLFWTLSRGVLPRNIWKRALLPAFFSAAAQVAFVAAFYQIPPGLLTFGMRIQIVFAAVGAAMLFPAERVIVRKPGFIVGALAVLCGTIGVAALRPGAFDAGASDRAATLLGTGLAAFAGIGYACYALAVRKCLAGVSARLSFSVISLYVGLAMIVLMVLFGRDQIPSLLALDTKQWGLLVLSVLTGLAVGHVVYFIAMEKLGVAPATGVVQLQPLTVAAASYFVFGELFSLPQVLCGLFAIGGAVLMLVTQHRAKRGGPKSSMDTLPTNPEAAAELAQQDASPVR